VLPLALLLLAQAAAEVSVTAVPSKTEVTVGETFAVDLKATGPPGTTFTFPGEAATDTFELRTPPAGLPAAAAAPEPGTHRYEAAVFALGEATLPPIPVRYRLPDGTEGEASTEAVALKVVSLLPKSAEEQKLADIRGPQPVGIGTSFWIALGLALVLVAALAGWLLRRRRKAEAPTARPAPDVPADVAALRALDALAASGLASRGDYRAFYIRLTEVAKRYLERRLGAPVLEMTTAETIAFLRGHAHGGDLAPVVRDLADAADRIKFAKGHGLAHEADRHLAAVRALVPVLEARLRPVETEPKAEGKAA
jgi:LPXTG-motif cell wall-anchored protein